VHFQNARNSRYVNTTDVKAELLEPLWSHRHGNEFDRVWEATKFKVRSFQEECTKGSGVNGTVLYNVRSYNIRRRRDSTCVPWASVS
jgi:hypothetical protein